MGWLSRIRRMFYPSVTPLVIKHSTTVTDGVDKLTKAKWEATHTIEGTLELAQIPTPLTGKDADSVDGVHLPATIASVLSDHTKAVHDALAINADLLDSLHAADFALVGHIHSQYFLIADHTKAVHDALGINADQVDGHDLDQDVKVASTPTFGELTVSRADVSGDGVKVTIRDTAVDYLSFAVVAMRAGLGNEGGMFFGSLDALDAYGIANGVTFGPGTATQDIGFRVGTDITGFGSGPSMIIKATRKIGIKTKDPTADFDVNSDIIRLRTAKTPASAGAAGNAGDICWDANYIYVCVATNTWKRTAIATW